MEILLPDQSKYGIHYNPDDFPDSIPEILSEKHNPDHKGKTESQQEPIYLNF